MSAQEPQDTLAAAVAQAIHDSECEAYIHEGRNGRCERAARAAMTAVLAAGWRPPDTDAAAVVHVHASTAPDMETRARLFNEGYETAIAQGIAADATLADEWLEQQRGDAVRAALAKIEALYGGEPPPVWIKDTKIVRASAYRRDLGATVTESLLRVDDVRAVVRELRDRHTQAQP